MNKGGGKRDRKVARTGASTYREGGGEAKKNSILHRPSVTRMRGSWTAIYTYLSGLGIECYRPGPAKAVKAKVIALYAVVLSNANHRRQNVRRGEANRVCGLTAPLLNPISSLPVSLASSRFIHRFCVSTALRNSSTSQHFLLPFQFHDWPGGRGREGEARRRNFSIDRSPSAIRPRSVTNMVKNRLKTIYKPINHPAKFRFES